MQEIMVAADRIYMVRDWRRTGWPLWVCRTVEPYYTYVKIVKMILVEPKGRVARWSRIEDVETNLDERVSFKRPIGL